jgi:hypothetical protein
METEDKNLNKILNLLRFTVCLNGGGTHTKLLSQSPDYIIEKYEHWIGIEPITDYPHYTPDDLISFFTQYEKTWGKGSSIDVRRHLLYFGDTNLNLSRMVQAFERYFAPIQMISSQVKSGLHPLSDKFTKDILELNGWNLVPLLRDMRLRDYIFYDKE